MFLNYISIIASRIRKWGRLQAYCHYVIAVVLCVSSCGTIAKFAPLPDYAEPNIAYEPQGILESVVVPTSVPGPSERRMFVYLPKSYSNNPDKRYPVLYLLHGASGTELSWIRQGNILQNIDRLTEDGDMEETILVLPNTNQYNDDKDYGHGRRKNMVEGFGDLDGAVETGFVRDVVMAVDSLYRTIPEKNSRALAGLSFGALQTIHISANYPDMFGYLGMFSPVAESFVKIGPYAKFYSRLKKKLAIQFADPPKLYWLMTGNIDIFFPRLESYMSYLNRKGYVYEAYITTGGHNWHNWELFSIMFLRSLWQ